MILVICKKCNEEKDISSFWPHKRTKNRLHPYCKLCSKTINKEYLENNKDKRQAYLERSKEHRKEWNRLYKAKRRQVNIQYKLTDNLRRRMRKALTHNYKKSSAVKDLGCTIQELKQYLENQFQEGMTWENYGNWHIDHIRPISSFEKKAPVSDVWALSNLQPLWAIDNLRKNNKLNWKPKTS